MYCNLRKNSNVGKVPAHSSIIPRNSQFRSVMRRLQSARGRTYKTKITIMHLRDSVMRILLSVSPFYSERWRKSLNLRIPTGDSLSANRQLFTTPTSKTRILLYRMRNVLCARAFQKNLQTQRERGRQSPQLLSLVESSSRPAKPYTINPQVGTLPTF